MTASNHKPSGTNGWPKICSRNHGQRDSPLAIKSELTVIKQIQILQTKYTHSVYLSMYFWCPSCDMRGGRAGPGSSSIAGWITQRNEPWRSPNRLNWIVESIKQNHRRLWSASTSCHGKAECTWRKVNNEHSERFLILWFYASSTAAVALP